MWRRGAFLLLAAVGTLAAVVGLTLPRGQADPPAGTFLLTVAPGDAARGAPGAGPRTTIVRAGGADRPRFLVRDFDSAESPSPDFEGRRLAFVGRRRADEPRSIWEMTIDGRHLRKITAGHGAPAGPAFLPDGRIVFSDVPSDAVEAGAGVRSLFSCAPDGSDIRRLTFGLRRDELPEVLPDGRLRFRSRSLAADGAVLMTVHPDGTQAAAFPAGLSALEPVIAAIAPAPGDGRSEGTLPPGIQAPDGHVVVAMTPLAAHPAPRILTSVVDPSRTTGTLLCLDAYASRIPAIAGLPRGAIRSVRLSRVRAGAPAGDAEILGEAPVAEDGSFFVTVPADVPLSLVLLAGDGKVLGVLRSGVWVRPNENRGCIGCHEEPDRAPENRRPLAILHDPSPLRPAIASRMGEHGAR
jgi:hypothetical protein